MNDRVHALAEVKHFAPTVSNSLADIFSSLGSQNRDCWDANRPLSGCDLCFEELRDVSRLRGWRFEIFETFSCKRGLDVENPW